MLNKVKITQAARATSAASSFFDPVSIDGETFVDGATGANNPVSTLWTEAKEIWEEPGEHLEDNLRCLVSIGTGVPSETAFGKDPMHIVKALMAISLDTEREAEAFQRAHGELFRGQKAFRFNVSHGLENVGLEEVSKLNIIKAMTRKYFEGESVMNLLESCARSLRGRKC